MGKRATALRRRVAMFATVAMALGAVVATGVPAAVANHTPTPSGGPYPDQTIAGDPECTTTNFPGTRSLLGATQRQSFVPSRGAQSHVSLCLTSNFNASFTAIIFERTPDGGLVEQARVEGNAPSGTRFVTVALPAAVAANAGQEYLLEVVGPLGDAPLALSWRLTCATALLTNQCTTASPDRYTNGRATDGSFGPNADFGFRTLTPSTADLTGSFDAAPRHVCPDRTFPAQITVTNAVTDSGGAEVRPSHLAVELASGAASEALARIPLGNLGPGEQATQQVDLSIPAGALDGHDGRAELRLTVDVDGVVVEEDEANNTASTDVILTSCDAAAIESIELTADRTEVPAGVGEVPIGALPIASIPFTDVGLAGAPLTQNPLTQNPLTQNPLTQNPLTQNPLTQNPIVDSPLTQNSFLFGAPFSVLRQITLTSIPLSRPGGWQAILDRHAEIVAATGSGSDPIAHVPLQQLSLLDVMFLDPTPQPPVRFAEMDLTESGLGGLVMAATALGATPLADVPLPTGQPWCGFLLEAGIDCAEHEIDEGVATLVTANLLGLDMASVPFEQITMDTVRVHAQSPLATVALQHSNPDLEYDVRLTPWATVPVTGSVAGLVDCAAVSCSAETSLADVTNADAFVAGTTVADLLGALAAEDLAAVSLSDAIRGTTRNTASLPLEGANLAQVQLSALAQGGPFVGYSVTVAAASDGASLVDPELVVTLPDGFSYVPDSAVLSASDELAVLGEATVTRTATLGDVVSFQPDLYVAAGDTVTLTVQANAGATLGEFLASAEASGVAIPGPYAAAVGPTAAVTVIERFEPDAPDADPQTWTEPAADTLVFSHISAPGDLDTWRIPVPAVPGSHVKIVVSHLPADYDILLGSATENPLTQNPLTQNPLTQNPLTQNPLTQNPIVPEAGTEWHANQVADTTQPETLQDLPLTQNPLTQNGVRAVSVQRGDRHETIILEATDGEGGYYPLVVAGYNGASSDEPYVLRYHVTPPTDFDLGACQPAPFVHGTGAEGTLPDPNALPADTNVLYLVARQRFTDAYSATALQQVEDEIAAVNAAGLGVNGVVLPIEGTRWDGEPNAVADAYAAWDAARCDQTAINTTAGAIRDLVLEYRSARDIEHVVVLGDDDQIPYLRVRDDAMLANERSYLSRIVAEVGIEDLDGDPSNGLQPAFATPHTAALASGLFLTDDHLGTAQPRPWLDQAAWIPDIGLGRLTADPGTMVAALAQFRGSNGELSPDLLEPTDTAVAGYDHLADGSTAIADALDANLAVTARRLISETWTRAQIADVLSFGPGADDVITSINGHADHRAFLPALGNLLGDTSDLITATDLADTLPIGSVVFSMACHFGYDLTTQAGAIRDFADAVAARQGVLVASTGYSYGDTATIAAGELFTSLLADNLDGSLPFGHAVALTKAQHHAREGVYGGEYFKSMQAMVTTGLPMYRIAGGGSAPSAPEYPEPQVDPSTGLLSIDLDFDFPLVASDASCATGQSCLIQRTSPDGRYYEVIGELGYAPLAVSGRPVSPRAIVDLSSLTDGNLRVHGAIVTNVTSSDVTGFDPAFARAIVDSPLREPEPQALGTVFPTLPLRISTIDTPLGEQQTLVLLPSTFRSTGLSDGEVVGDLRLDTRMSVRLLLTESSDNVPATISTVHATRQGDDVAFTVTAAPANAPIVSAVALYRDEVGTWHRATLSTDDGGTTWFGTGDLPTLSTDATDLLIQVLDGDGDTAFYRRKGDLTPLGAAGDLVFQIDGTPGTNGWYQGPVTITLPPLTDGQYQIRDGNEPFQPIEGNTFTVSEEGVHRIDIVGPDGSRADDIVIAIDATAPTVTLRTPADGAAYANDATIVADYECGDFGASGAAGCLGDLPDGATIQPVAGKHTFTVTAVDGAGNETSVTHTYRVLSPPLEFDGFYSPITNDAWNRWSLSNSSTPGVPFKWRLYRNGKFVSDTSVVTSMTWQQVTCSSDPLGSDEIGSPTVATSTDGHGIQVFQRRMQVEIATSQDFVGTCQRFDLALEDGSTHSAWLQFTP